MKKTIFTFLLLLSALQAQDCCCPPCLLSGLYLDTKPATFKKESLEGEHLHYAESNLSFSYTYPWCQSSGLTLGAGYTTNLVKWEENPFFHESRFNYIDFFGGVYTKAIPRFLWSLVGFAYIDPNTVDLADYSLYQVILHGKYFVSNCLTMNAGFILELGLNREMIWPILGIDWNFADNWRLGFVYPLDLCLEYKILPCLSASANARFLRTRHRVEPNEPESRGIFEYKNWGGEGELIWRPLSSLCIKGFVGTTFGGDFKVSDQNNHHGKHQKLNSTPYAGVSGNWYF